MRNPDIIITIGRQYGSGGREIGERLAQALGCSCYDTMLLDRAAKQSGLSREIMQRYDEKLADKWLSLALAQNTGVKNHLPLPVQAALSQFEAIRKIGSSGSAVIVGRCADYVLRGQNNVVAAFIHSPMPYRVNRVAARNHISLEEAEKRIRNTDRNRSAYYNYYTGKVWGASASYDLSIDSSRFGILGAVELLKECAPRLLC